MAALILVFELEPHSPRLGRGIDVWKTPFPDGNSHDNALEAPTVRRRLD